jgi:hypothetical protein
MSAVGRNDAAASAATGRNRASSSDDLEPELSEGVLATIHQLLNEPRPLIGTHIILSRPANDLRNTAGRNAPLPTQRPFRMARNLSRSAAFRQSRHRRRLPFQSSASTLSKNE